MDVIKAAAESDLSRPYTKTYPRHILSTSKAAWNRAVNSAEEAKASQAHDCQEPWPGRWVLMARLGAKWLSFAM